MTAGIVVRGRRVGAVPLLAALFAIVVIVALLTPESTNGSNTRTTYATGPVGLRVMYELAQRMGWQTRRRVTPFDTLEPLSVQVVLSPQQALGAAEVHRLLMNVRRGGGLIFDAETASEIGDSLGVGFGSDIVRLAGIVDSTCIAETTLRARTLAIIPPIPIRLRWRRPPPGTITPISAAFDGRETAAVGDAFQMGKGRVVALSTSEMVANDAVRTCGWGADITAARAFEFVKPAGVAHPVMVFDEFHHGYGAHGGSVLAISTYLSHTASGRFLVQALVAALVLLLASLPRPIVPRHVGVPQRRSPLEHADALAFAYADVGATRTATSRLVSGLRRRAGRTVALPASSDDGAFLDAVVRRTPQVSASVSVVRRALNEQIASAELAAVATAVRDIEHQLTTQPPITTRS